MKNKVLMRVLSVLLCLFVFCCSSISAFASSGGLVTEKPTASDLPKSQQTSLNFYKRLFDELVKQIDSNLRNKQQIITLNRLYYFSLMLDNSLNCSSSVSSGNKFNDDYLWFYWNFYCSHLNWTDGSSVGFFTVANEDGIITNVNDVTFNIENLSFFLSNWSGRHVYWELSDPPVQFKNFRDYYNYLYSVYVSDVSLSSGYLSDVASPVISSQEFKDLVNSSNTQYFPKNAMGKMTYRIDDRWHKRFDVTVLTQTANSYFPMSTYHKDSKFYAVGSDEMYFVFFYKTNEDTFYSAYQYHLSFSSQDHWFSDRDEIQDTTYSAELEYWNMVDGSRDDSVKQILFSDSSYYAFDMGPWFYNYGKSLFFRFYDNYEDYTGFSNRHNKTLNDNKFNLLYRSDLTTSISASSSTLNHFCSHTLVEHDENCSFDGLCDVGYIASTTPIETVYRIDTTKIPDNYYITISGDTVYDYSITNPETGQTDTVSNYITNNYTYVTNNNPGSSASGGDFTVGGHIDVSGSVDVGVDITVSVPDININVNGGGSVGVGGGQSYDIPDTDIFNSYYDSALDESSDFRQFLSSFFGFLPPEIIMLLGIGLTFVILARIFGR